MSGFGFDGEVVLESLQISNFNENDTLRQLSKCTLYVVSITHIDNAIAVFGDKEGEKEEESEEGDVESEGDEDNEEGESEDMAYAPLRADEFEACQVS